jgi:transcriptional regulator with XRE-family HTH domain
MNIIDVGLRHYTEVKRMQIDLDLLPWNQRLKMLRTLHGWSQEETANKCNVNQKVYWSWEIAERFPQKNSRIAISKAFNVPEYDLFGDVPQRKAI